MESGCCRLNCTLQDLSSVICILAQRFNFAEWADLFFQQQDQFIKWPTFSSSWLLNRHTLENLPPADIVLWSSSQSSSSYRLFSLSRQGGRIYELEVSSGVSQFYQTILFPYYKLSFFVAFHIELWSEFKAIILLYVLLILAMKTQARAWKSEPQTKSIAGFLTHICCLTGLSQCKNFSNLEASGNKRKKAAAIVVHVEGYSEAETAVKVVFCAKRNSSIIILNPTQTPREKKGVCR